MEAFSRKPAARTLFRKRGRQNNRQVPGGVAQLADGRHVDARDAVWVIDCERKLGAVAFERAFAREGEHNQTVQSIGDERAFADPSIVEVDKLAFGQAAAGSMQARFGDALCVVNPDLQ
jgi:hypothetical protein